MTAPQTTSLSLPMAFMVTGPMAPGYDEILTPEALAFVATLNRDVQCPPRSRCSNGAPSASRRSMPGRCPTSCRRPRDVRAGDWTIAPIPADLQDRRVEITGPVDRKMVINALNSGAKVFMADFEDANAPTWDNLIEGQINLRDAVRRTISFSSPEGKQYRLNEQVAVLFVRPRGWHLPEKHVLAGWRAGLRQPLRLRAVLLPQRRRTAGAWHAGRTSTCPRWRATWRRACGTTSSPGARDARHPSRHDQGDGADRDAARRLRDGRDPLRAARPLRRA